MNLIGNFIHPTALSSNRQCPLSCHGVIDLPSEDYASSRTLTGYPGKMSVFEEPIDVFTNGEGSFQRFLHPTPEQ